MLLKNNTKKTNFNNRIYAMLTSGCLQSVNGVTSVLELVSQH